MKKHSKLRVRFTNDFHNTEREAYAYRPYGSDAMYIHHRQCKEIRFDLCGVRGCTCGHDVAGCRPKQVEESLGEWHEVYGEVIKVLDGEYMFDGKKMIKL